MAEAPSPGDVAVTAGEAADLAMNAQSGSFAAGYRWSMHEKLVALVTGANKGIGLAIARRLGRLDYTVVVGARDRARGEEAVGRLRDDGVHALLALLDVTRRETIAAAAEWIRLELGRLDVLVNNAGIARGRAAPSAADLDAVREVFETNVFGVIAVTQAMLPLLRAAPAGRIVNVSSLLGSLGTMSDPSSDFSRSAGVTYPPSKSALNAITVAFANELRATPIKVNSVCPGYTATDLNGHTGTRTVEEAARAPVELATLAADGPTGGFFNDSGALPW